MKELNLTPLLPYNLSWDFERKSEYNDIIKNWKIIFQAFDARKRHFLDLLNNDFYSKKPLYTKGGS